MPRYAKLPSIFRRATKSRARYTRRPSRMRKSYRTMRRKPIYRRRIR